MNDKTLVERIRQLVTEANLPWRTDLIDVVRDDPNDDGPWTVAHCGAGEETADLIVEVVNATPRLLDTIVAQANEIEWLNTLIGDKAAKQIEADGNRIEALQADNARLREKIAVIADVVAIWARPNPAFPTRQRDPLDQAAWDRLAKFVGEMADDALGKAALQETER